MSTRSGKRLRAMRVEQAKGGRCRDALASGDDARPSALLAHAATLMEQRQWKQATRVLVAAEATAATDEDRRRARELLAVAGADGRRHQLSSDAVYALKAETPRPISTWVAYAHVALARNNFARADAAARSALVLDPTSHDGWTGLAASYAGLGWFDEATSCLDRVNREQINEVDHWRLGRAVNRWAMTGTPIWAIGAGAALLFGTLAIAVLLAVPLVARTIRLRRLATMKDGAWFASQANQAWRGQRAVRTVHSIAIVAAVVSHILLMATF